MKKFVESKGVIFPVPGAEKNYTIKANVPELGGIVEFVLCRVEGPYTDGRRPDWVKMGTLHDDLARRDFKMNAIARDEAGILIDPFNGQEDIKFKLITCVGDTRERLKQDSIRLIRAIRFSITKDFVIAPEIEECLNDNEIVQLLDNLSLQRTTEELVKCFRYSTVRSMHMLFHVYPAIGNKIFENKQLWLKPTLEKA